MNCLDCGFVPVKRWLLIACDTALYTIVLHKCLCRTMIWSAYYMYMYNETIRVLLKQKVTSASATYMVSVEATRVNLIKRETTNMDTQADSQQSFPQRGDRNAEQNKDRTKSHKNAELEEKHPWNNCKWRSYQPSMEECLWCTKWINSVVLWNSRVGLNIIDPPHDKTNKVSVRPAKTQISLGIHPVWSESSLSA